MVSSELSIAAIDIFFDIKLVLSVVVTLLSNLVNDVQFKGN